MGIGVISTAGKRAALVIQGLTCCVSYRVVYWDGHGSSGHGHVDTQASPKLLEWEVRENHSGVLLISVQRKQGDKSA